MTSQETQTGSITILPEAIMTVARAAALESYGVINLAPGSFREVLRRAFCPKAGYGITVRSDADGLVLVINLIIEYGLRIKSVTDSVADSVKYNVQRTIGIPVKRIDIHVRGLRISNTD
jgi:uncharacterized alkaline shock family protein YloU